MLLQFLLISAGSLILLWVSRRSLQNARVHGFYRFFAFEVILIAVVVNLPVWFSDPFSLHQIISWVLLAISIYLVLTSFYLILTRGRPEKSCSVSTNYTFENTSQLVKTGIYGFIRHPMYGSLLFLSWGLFFKNVSIVNGLLTGMATIFIYWTARIEEKENIRFFGDAYRQYMTATKMFIPLIW